ncbi:Cell division cycle protein 23 [Amphibalanus amphitrite]|uniref:Cell division cycle protein 23 n=1 Tax=Amphibalanus amphitrite TaxID=1232801 RepID=A0A6A4VMB0_AMPAM|nr:Cell division cycle protein 23 [Amphibalanus amphitrite]
MREVDQAIELFQNLLKEDPCRLENMDSYSNLLYVKGMQVELCSLAHNLSNINKYSVETCCVIGNYYSLKNHHEKAILYFQRALRLNANYLSAWTLLGHEYLELKNTNAAIQCYRQAIDVNRLDYRAWYWPRRMLMAMGESYEKLDKLQEAKRCYWKAHSIGDIEGVALLRLAKLFERLCEPMRAAAAYADYIRDSEGQDIWDRDEQAAGLPLHGQPLPTAGAARTRRLTTRRAAQSSPRPARRARPYCVRWPSGGQRRRPRGAGRQPERPVRPPRRPRPRERRRRPGPARRRSVCHPYRPIGYCSVRDLNGADGGGM